MDTLRAAESSSIGFMAAEENLNAVLSKAKTSADVTKAVEAAVTNGARKGSAALTGADKLLTALQKAEKKTKELTEKLEKLKANPFRPKPKPEAKEGDAEAKEEKEEPPPDPIKELEDEIKKTMDA